MTGARDPCDIRFFACNLLELFALLGLVRLSGMAMIHEQTRLKNVRVVKNMMTGY